MASLNALSNLDEGLTVKGKLQKPLEIDRNICIKIYNEFYRICKQKKADVEFFKIWTFTGQVFIELLVLFIYIKK